MLTLHPGSACDVCAEEFGAYRPPHCIPCGHILCAQCCSAIVEKTPPRLSPVCPFCREQFSSDSVRLIRLDFPFSGRSTPRRLPLFEASNELQSEVLARRAERPSASDGASKTRSEARRLEEKVARIAATKTSVEEVSSLHREVEDWLMNAVRDERNQALYLSALLLRAILMNHSVQSESSKSAKQLENSLKSKIDELEETKEKYEAELRRQRNLYAQKSQDYQNLRTEVNRLKALATILPTSPASESRSKSTSPAPQSTSPVPLQNPVHTQTVMTASTTSSTPTPTLRASPMHSRSISMTSRSMTPATPMRTYTPSPAAHLLARAQTPAARSPQALHTRTYTPAPPVPTRMTTPAPALSRAQTPALTRTRRISVSQHTSPQKMMRSASEEKEVLHEIWIPPPDPDVFDHGPPTPTKTKSVSRPPSRMTTYSTFVQQQYGRGRPVSPT
ncbi:hypothetical protein M378DRAFT_77461 [Amanita muscaria Koide BX008]|uniref:RING-type E3 ubiquitin transferase n=1 Tax=Amanita muscaria (strain Koide BX008) TaxID=946122 RepID=A0A0C2X6Y9_AMAMK|nr:hypothetical protein M378DRAFT_77461 [Amanita muscaria Koide BX008]